ncbi:hypothetical protein [uncultured Prevotella sp.]|nr:hypothetical protein [uncultured Prevotella sp.]
MNFQLECSTPIAFSMRYFIKFFDNATSLNVSPSTRSSIGRKS